MATSTTSYSPESWEYARGYAGMFGTTPSSFTSVIRTLMNEHAAGLAQTVGNSKYFIVRLLKSPSLMAPFYFAASAFSPEKLVANGPTSVDELVKAFTPFELAYTLGLVYLVRRAQGLCEAEELLFIFDKMVPEANTAFALGRAIPAIGAGTALIEATISSMAVAAITKHDLKGFKEYRKSRQKEDGEWNTEEEIARWGCNHLQIASVLLQTLGFGITRSNAYINAYSSKSEVGGLEEVNMTKDFRMAKLWREAFSSTTAAPSIPLPPKYYPTKAAQEAAFKTIAALRSDTDAQRWLLKNKSDLPVYQVSAKTTVTQAEEVGASSNSEDIASDIDSLAKEIEDLSAESPK